LVKKLLIEQLVYLYTTHAQGNHAQINHFYVSNIERIEEIRNELNNLLLNCRQTNEFHQWLRDLFKGKVFIVDANKRAYHQAGQTFLDDYDLENATITLALPNGLGFIYIFTKVKIETKNWPTFLQDITNVCSIVIERDVTRGYSILTQRRRWMEQLIEGELSQEMINEGINLGLPITNGQIWTLALKKTNETIEPEAHLRLNGLTIDQLAVPFTLINENIGVVLVEQTTVDPIAYRDHLLRHVAIKPIWLIHGARYNNTHQLQSRLIQSVNLVKDVREKNKEQYVNELNSITVGLQSLLNHPKLKEHLIDFS